MAKFNLLLLLLLLLLLKEVGSARLGVSDLWMNKRTNLIFSKDETEN